MNKRRKERKKEMPLIPFKNILFLGCATLLYENLSRASAQFSIIILLIIFFRNRKTIPKRSIEVTREINYIQCGTGSVCVQMIYDAIN